MLPFDQDLKRECDLFLGLMKTDQRVASRMLSLPNAGWPNYLKSMELNRFVLKPLVSLVVAQWGWGLW